MKLWISTHRKRVKIHGTPNGGASTIDYLMGYSSLIPEVKEFTITGGPLAWQ